MTEPCARQKIDSHCTTRSTRFVPFINSQELCQIINATLMDQEAPHEKEPSQNGPVLLFPLPNGWP